VDGLKDVRLNKVMAYVTGGTKNGFKRRVRVLWEMRVYDGRKKRPAGVLCPVDADSVDASVLVEEREVHVQERKWSCRCRVTRYRGASIRTSDAGDIEITNRTPAEK
jgi:hypothetical protein